MTREQTPTYEQRQIRYDRVAMEFDGENHRMVERTGDGYELVDE